MKSKSELILIKLNNIVSTSAVTRAHCTRILYYNIKHLCVCSVTTMVIHCKATMTLDVVLPQVIVWTHKNLNPKKY